MKEPRFIELLNLYVDQQLSATEAAELESEIKRDPARRRTYQQYCRMQKACAQLFEHERSSAPASAVLARDIRQADRKVINFPPAHTRPFWSVGYSVAAVAAAACVAFVVIHQRDAGSPEGSGTAVAAVAEQPSTIAASPTSDSRPATPVLVGLRETEFKPIFTTQALRPTEKQDLFFITSSKSEESPLEWVRQVQLDPVRKVSLDEFTFGSRTPDRAVNATFSPASNDEHAVEMNAFQFQR